MCGLFVVALNIVNYLLHIVRCEPQMFVRRLHELLSYAVFELLQNAVEKTVDVENHYGFVV